MQQKLLYCLHRVPFGRHLRRQGLCGIFLLCVVASCQKVINVNIKGADEVYVIEGVLTNQAGGCQVLISHTKNFSDDNSFAGIDSAQVSITDSNGVKNNIPGTTTAGVYALPGLVGIQGMRYMLNVTIGGQVFTASSTMPHQVFLDTVYITNNSFFNETLKLVNIQYTDPPGKGNSYRFLQYINGVKTNTIFISNDDLYDGRTIAIQLIPQDGNGTDTVKIVKGDKVKVEMLCIDPEVYKYWYSLDQSATGNANSASPANPVTNISGGALGYFSAQTYQAKTITAR